jgi:pyruvate dehydrogenase phosphatase
VWDRLSSEEAALLTAAYLDEPTRPDVPKTDLPSLYPFAATRQPAPFPVSDAPGVGCKAKGIWVFDGDENAATHLIRNAINLGSRAVGQMSLSIRTREAKPLRDDTAAM